MLRLVFAMFLVLSLFGCEVFKGPRGTAGSQGPQGQTGETGATGGTGAAGGTGATGGTGPQGLPGDPGSSNVQVYRYSRAPDANPYIITCPELANSNVTLQVTGVDRGTGKVYHLGMVETGSPSYSHYYNVDADNKIIAATNVSDSTPVATALTLRDGTHLDLEIYITVFGDTPIDKTPSLIYGRTIPQILDR